MSRKLQLAALALVSAAAVGGAYAAQSSENDALAITKANTSLTQAISEAEQHVGGKASRAEFENEKGKSVFEVEVVKGNSVVDVRVDPTSGKVVSAVEDKSDHTGGHDDD